MKVEFLRAWEDGHWDTEIVDVPEEQIAGIKRSEAGDDDWTLQAWAREHLGVQAQYRSVVLFAVYSTLPEERPWESTQRHDLPAGMHGED